MDYLNAQRGLVNLFTSDSYRLLCLLDDLQTETPHGKRVRESQEEIAELFHVSKGKLNPLMQSLVAAGCIQKYRARSGYTVTQLGTSVIEIVGQLANFELSNERTTVGDNLKG